ncbi:MAG: 30S ribosome-binding factor RbfA [Bacilli bacterium]|nr:30S ribosome-binding factor RbfA [Bacilli bacterium]
MANNIRIKRLNHAFMEEISVILMQEVKNEDLKFVTITDCDITSDLSFAKVYFTILNKENKEQITKELNNASSFIRGKLSERIEIRHTPELKFIYDETIEYGEKMESILNNLK